MDEEYGDIDGGWASVVGDHFQFSRPSDGWTFLPAVSTGICGLEPSLGRLPSELRLHGRTAWSVGAGDPENVRLGLLHIEAGLRSDRTNWGPKRKAHSPAPSPLQPLNIRSPPSESPLVQKIAGRRGSGRQRHVNSTCRGYRAGPKNGVQSDMLLGDVKLLNPRNSRIGVTQQAVVVAEGLVHRTNRHRRPVLTPDSSFERSVDVIRSSGSAIERACGGIQASDEHREDESTSSRTR